MVETGEVERMSVKERAALEAIASVAERRSAEKRVARDAVDEIMHWTERATTCLLQAARLWENEHSKARKLLALGAKALDEAASRREKLNDALQDRRG